MRKFRFFSSFFSYHITLQTQRQFIMSRLPSDVLVPIFKNLNSKDMVQDMSVSKEWAQTINETKKLWRKLVLPNRERGWHLDILRQFDEKSESTLEEVSFKTNCFRRPDFGFNHYFEKNKASLTHLKITIDTEFFSNTMMSDYQYSKKVSELPLKLPNLVDCRIMVNTELDRFTERVKLVHHLDETQRVITALLSEHLVGYKEEEERKKALPDESSKLKVLWIPHVSPILHSHPEILDNLSSLHILAPFDPSILSNLLRKGPANKLKHLGVVFRKAPVFTFNFAPPEGPIVPVTLPQLRVLEISVEKEYPSWLRIPTSAAIIIFWNSPAKIPLNLPSISKLWIKGTRTFTNLHCRCPLLKELRFIGNKVSKEQREPLVRFLEERKASVAAKRMVDGVQMRPLNTVVVSFKGLGEETRSQVQGLVGQVVDARRVYPHMKVDIGGNF